MAILEATPANFAELIQGEYVVIDVYGDHCGPCMYVAPFFEAASIDMPFVTFAHICIDREATKEENLALVKPYMEIDTIPTFLFFRKGELVHRRVGGMDRNGLNKQLAKLLYE